MARPRSSINWTIPVCELNRVANFEMFIVKVISLVFWFGDFLTDEHKTYYTLSGIGQM
jgi:hypothetical protein